MTDNQTRLSMSDADILIKEIALLVLGHGYLHLGDMTLKQFINKELGVSDEHLDIVQNLLEGESK